MLNQNNWPVFFKDASNFFTNYGFNVDEKTMALIIGRTDQNTFVLLSKLIGILMEDYESAEQGEKAFANLGEFGKLFHQNEISYPENYQYIFFITHQTETREVFEKCLMVGSLLMQYTDLQVQQDGIDMKNEKVFVAYVNECIQSISKNTYFQLKINSELDEIVRDFNLERLLDALIFHLRSGVICLQNSIQDQTNSLNASDKWNPLIDALKEIYKSRNLTIREQFINEIAEFELYAATLLYEICYGFDYESTEEDTLSSIFISRLGEAGQIAEDSALSGDSPRWKLFSHAMNNNLLQEMWYFGYASSHVAIIRFPDKKNITLGNVQKKLRKLAKVLPEDWADKHDWFDDGKLAGYVKDLSLEKFLKDFNGLLYEQWTELMENQEEK